jgi:hypothetical protein
MTDEERKLGWLATWRAKHPPKTHRNAMDKLFGGADGDSPEKLAERHTSRGEALEAEDRARIVKGSSGGA